MNVFVSRRIPGNGVARLQAIHRTRLWEENRPVPPDVLRAEIATAEGALLMLTDRVDATLLDAAPNLRVVSNMAVGYDNIDVAACTARGIAVCNTPGVLTDATADLAFGLLIAAARRFHESEHLLRSGEWGPWQPNLLLGMDIAGRTLGVVGMGQIGRAVARRAKGFDMQVVYSGRPKPDLDSELDVSWRSLDDLLAESDFVSLHVPLTVDTHHLINAERLAQMKSHAVLINTARGGVVDTSALVDALGTGRIAAAGLDVFETEPLPLDSPLLTLPNVVLMPHIGSATITTRTAMADLATDNLLAVLAGERPKACVNPETL